jgi:hypothetical protein
MGRDLKRRDVGNAGFIALPCNPAKRRRDVGNVKTQPTPAVLQV